MRRAVDFNKQILPVGQVVISTFTGRHYTIAALLWVTLDGLEYYRMACGRILRRDTVTIAP
jgi:hypothetical protein